MDATKETLTWDNLLFKVSALWPEFTTAKGMCERFGDEKGDLKDAIQTLLDLMVTAQLLEKEEVKQGKTKVVSYRADRGSSADCINELLDSLSANLPLVSVSNQKTRHYTSAVKLLEKYGRVIPSKSGGHIHSATQSQKSFTRTAGRVESFMFKVVSMFKDTKEILSTDVIADKLNNEYPLMNASKSKVQSRLYSARDAGYLHRCNDFTPATYRLTPKGENYLKEALVNSKL